MVLATMADSEREELEKLIEDWNASRLDMFTISKPDANLEFSGNMRFYFQESGAKDRKVSTKVLRVSSSDTTDEVMKVLVSKFHPDLKMLTMPNYSLYEVHETGAEAQKLELDQRPLYVQLYWQQDNRDGRFLLKSEEDQMTQKLFEDEESAIDPNKRNLKQRQSKRERKKKKIAEENPKNLAAAVYEDKPASSFTRTKSNPEAVMKIQRKKKLEDRLKKLQNPETGGGGGGPLRIFAESLQPENPYKTILCASNDTTETVLKDALEKYEVPPEEMDQYCLTMVTIAPGSHSDPESSSGVRERVVPDKDCPAGIAAAWPESKGELRFYLKKIENMPKSRRQPRKKHDEPHGRAGGRPGPTLGESSPPATKETTVDVTEHSPTEKEPGSPAVHIVDAARDLPATLEFRESGEDAFFAVVVSEVNGSAVNFKLAPTFTLYMCCRYRLSPKFHPDFPQNKRREKVEMTANKVASMMWQTVKENNGMAGHLAFWMANSSEFLHFLKQDMELSSMTEESQKILAHTTQLAFRSLVQCIKAELQSCLPAFLDSSKESDLDEHGENGGDEKFDPMEGYQSTERSFKVRQYGPHGQPLGGDQWMGKRKKTSRPVVSDVLYTLKSAMSLLRRCRVNPALTIQLFSQVFHFMNMWLFNRIVLEPQLRLCTRSWGVRLRERLERLQAWAESQGLELAAECHLARISQAALLLQIPKQDSTAISSHCYKLNSVQLRQLLELYQPERDEPAISLELIEKAVRVAESTADEIARSEGQHVGLEEELDLNLPFLLPDDGYFSEKTRGVPPGLKEFLDPLITPGLCRLTIQPKASGLWTVHFKTPAVDLESPSPEVIKISINKGNKGMGVSIVAAKGASQEHYGIYVKEVIDGGPAAQDGRLKPGDQIIDVNGESLVGVQQEGAVKILTKAGSVVHMTVAKRAVYKHGLVELLSNVAPTQMVEALNRTAENRNLSPLPQKKETPPRAPPRYRPPQDSPQRSPPLNASVQSEVDQTPAKPEQKQVKPEPPRRRSAYERSSYESPEQPPVQAKPVAGYKLDEPPPGRKPVGGKAGVPLPYANPLDIQRRQKEMQQRKVEDQGKENSERERIAREQERMKEEREEAERLERMKREDQARQERERMEREQQERQRIERENQERQRIERENQERQRIERENQERQKIEREQQDRERREREEQERQRRERDEMERKRREEWEKKERERIEREESERRRQEEWKKQEQERLEREQREKEEHEKRMQQENADLDEMSRRERELEMMLEQKRREKEKRLKELQRRIQEEEEESERMERELRERFRRDRGERKEPQRMSRPSEEPQRMSRPSEEPQRITRPSVGSTQVHYVNDKGRENEKSELVRNEDMRSNRPVRAPTPAEESRSNPPMDYSRRPPLPSEDTRGNFGGPADESKSEDIRSNRPDYNKRGPVLADENRSTPPLDYSRRPPLPNEDNRGNFGAGKRPSLQDSKDDSFDMDPAEVERQFQQRLVQEASGKSEVDGVVRVIRVPVQQDNPRGNASGDMEDRPRARVDWHREEEERNRKEQQWRREQDEKLIRDFQQNDSFRQQPAGAVAEPVHPNQGDWEKEKELRRQHEEDDRLREARANQLRNKIIEQPEDDEGIRDTSYNGRTRRVKFASVRTEIIQPSPDAELAKPGVKFVHDGKVEDSDDEEFPGPPPPLDEEDASPPPPPQDQVDYYQRPPPPPKPKNLMSNGGGNPPEYRGANPPHYRDNEHIARARARISDEGYATYPGRQQHNNNYPVPKPRGGVSTEFSKSPSPDQPKLPLKDKMKVFNENTPPKRQMTSKWEQKWVNGDSL